MQLDPAPAVATASIMQRLRDETLEQHKHAERRPLERGLGIGSLPRELYVGLLGQRFCVHRTLDRLVADLCRRDSRLAGVVTDELLQTENLRADLDYLGVPAESVEPISSTQILCEEIEASAEFDAVALLGYYYVLEGSKNGAAYLAPRVRKMYDLPDERGTRYFDPHGARQRELWGAFKSRMDVIDLTHAERDAIVDAAKRMFDGISAIDDELCGVTDSQGV